MAMVEEERYECRRRNQDGNECRSECIERTKEVKRIGRICSRQRLGKMGFEDKQTRLIFFIVTADNFLNSLFKYSVDRLKYMHLEIMT